MYDYTGLRAGQVNMFFSGCVPCTCFDDPVNIYKVPRYSVKISLGTTAYGSRGRIIKEIVVECDCCGASRRYNVECYGVYQNDLTW